MTENLEKKVEDSDGNRISFSEMKTYKLCPYKHKILHIDKAVSYPKTIFTEYGSAVHHAIEYMHEKTEEKKDVKTFCENEIEKLIGDLPLKEFGKDSDEEKLKEKQKKLISEMKIQSVETLREYFLEMKNFFGNYEVFSVEEKILEPFENPYGKKFKGFIDMVIKLENGTYCILDTKTTSWGWDARKKSDKLTTYQLTYYKHFFSEKHKIPLDKIKTYFILLKRTVKKDRVEIFEVPCGPVKIKNSLQLLREVTTAIGKGIQIKNRLMCNPKEGYPCPFYKTEFCK